MFGIRLEDFGNMEDESGKNRYLKSAIIEEHHKGLVRLEPLQEVQSGSADIRYTGKVTSL